MHKHKEPVSTAEVGAALWQYVKRCDELLTAYHSAGSEYVDARDAYEGKLAHETLTAEGTVQQRKALADKNCRNEYVRFIKAETRFKYLKLALDTTRDQLVALESIGSNLRQENELQKYKT